VIEKNLSIVGNCLGETPDLAKALQDYLGGKFAPAIDSVFWPKQWRPFFVGPLLIAVALERS
jgi:hypothetical protein